MKTMKASLAWSILAMAFLTIETWACPLVKENPLIDGKLEDPAWQKLPWNSSFTRIGTKDQATAQTRFKCFNNGKYLFLAIICDEPNMDDITDCHQPDSILFWKNDTVEVTLIPDLTLISFYKLIITSKGQHADLLGMDDNTHTGKYVYPNPWESHADIRTSRSRQHWTVEMAIPFGALNYEAKNTDTWRLNVARNRWTATPPELSSWSVLPFKNHLQPKAFNLVTVQGFRPENYAYDIENVKGRLESQNKQLTYHVSANLHNETNSFRYFIQTCTMTNLKDGSIRRAEATVPLQAQSYQKSDMSIAGLKNGTYRLTWDLYARSRQRPVLCKSMTRTITVDYVPMTVRLVRPPYRNNLYATMPDKTIEAAIDVLEHTGAPITVELTGQGTRHVRHLPKAQPTNTVTFDGADLPEGTYQLKVICQGQRRLTSVTTIKKLPYRKGEIWLDARGVYHIDGKPFLSYGWYQHCGNTVEPYYNTVLNTARYADMKEALTSLRDNYRKRGMRSIVVPFQDLGGWNDWRWVVFKDPDTRKKNLTDDQRKKIVDFISVISKEDGLLGYYMADEPESRGNNPDWYEQAYKVIAETDPYHPCFMLNWGIEGIRTFYKSCDILLPDCYPQYYEDGSTSKPRWAPSDYAKVSTSLRPAWQMPIACCYPDLSFDGKQGIPATYYDQRSQVFQAFIHNVKGINIYAWFEAMRFSSAIFGAPAVAETVFHLKNYLLQDTETAAINVVTTPTMPQFQTGLKTYGGQLCLIAVNTSLQTVKAEFKLANDFNGKLYREHGTHSVTVNRGTFTDTLQPNETRIYLTDRKLAQRLILPETVRDKIKEHRIARRKPGNLIGLGELPPIKYLQYGQGKCPPGIPVLTASSDATVWITRQSGSLYYLVDGLTEILSGEFGWSPRHGDKVPWLNIALPKKATIKQVVLYSQGRNLKAGNVLVNGKRYPFEDTTMPPVLTIHLPEISTDNVRIEFTDFNLKRSTSITGRVLTEVEIY